MRVLLDSNVWLAILTTDGQCRRMWRRARLKSEICASPEIFVEIEEKLRLKFGFSPRHARLLISFVRRQTSPVQARKPPPNACRDAADNLILAAAIDSASAYLVTGDNDLLALKQFGGVGIVTPREFLEQVASI